MSKREGLHNVTFDVVLSCLHTVTYLVRPHRDDYLMCVRCSAGRTVLTITRKISTESPLRDTA